MRTFAAVMVIVIQLVLLPSAEAQKGKPFVALRITQKKWFPIEGENVSGVPVSCQVYVTMKRFAGSPNAEDVTMPVYRKLAPKQKFTISVDDFLNGYVPKLSRKGFTFATRPNSKSKRPPNSDQDDAYGIAMSQPTVEQSCFGPTAESSVVNELRDAMATKGDKPEPSQTEMRAKESTGATAVESNPSAPVRSDVRDAE
jgi:hypothetical protein